MSNLIGSLVKASGDDLASVVSDGIIGNENTFHLDLGCYAMNALISGSLFKGVASNRSIMLAGAESTGKTYFAMETAYRFLEENPDGIVVYFDTEKSIEEEMFEKRGIDTNQVVISQPLTIEAFRTSAVKILERYMSQDESERPKMLFVLDSMGMMPSEAEVKNMTEGKNVADMKKAQLLKATFRVLTLKMGVANVPLVVVGHTYANIGGYGAPTAVGGGSGAKYASSNILELKKAKVKEGTSQIGVDIKVSVLKSRHTREGKDVTATLMFDKGLDRYSGLLDLAVEAKVFEKLSAGRYNTPTEEKSVFGKHIKADPEKYFTEDVLKEIDKWTTQNFSLSAPKRTTDNDDAE